MKVFGKNLIFDRWAAGTVGLMLLASIAYTGLSFHRPIRYGLFRLGYEAAPVSVDTYLKFYSPLEADGSIGYLSGEAGEFLCGRMRSTGDASEFGAIVNLYAQRADGQQGLCVSDSDEDTRRRVIAYLIDGLDSDPALVGGKLNLLREAHTGEALDKGGLAEREYISVSMSRDAWKAWTEEKAFPIAVERYKAWWNSGLSWEEKKATDPVLGTIVTFRPCCG